MQEQLLDREAKANSAESRHTIRMLAATKEFQQQLCALQDTAVRKDVVRRLDMTHNSSTLFSPFFVFFNW